MFRAQKAWHLAPLLAVAAVLLATAPLSAGYWLDEALSVWVASGEIGSVWFKALQYQGQSPLYFLILSALRRIFASELAARLLSVFAVGAAVWFTAAIARELKIPPVPSALLMLAHEGVQRAAFQARPYSLGLLFVTAAVLAALYAQRSRRWPWGLVAIAACAGGYYCDYFFGAAALLLMMILGRGWRRRELLIWALFAAAVFTPGIYQLRLLAVRATELAYHSSADLSALAAALFPARFAGYLLIPGALVMVLARAKPQRAGGSWVLLLSWWILPVLLLFALSHLLDTRLLVERHYLWGAPGMALLGAALFGTLGAAAHRSTLAWVLAGLIGIRAAAADWQLEDWRGAASWSRAAADSPTVLLYSGLFEADLPELLNSAEAQDYLKAPLAVYGAAEIIVLPSSPEVSNDYLLEQIQPVIMEDRELAIIALNTRRRHGNGEVYSPHERWFEYLSSEYEVSKLSGPRELVQRAILKPRAVTLPGSDGP